MNQDDLRAWYLLTSKPRQDAYAEEQLNNQGYVTYRPLAVKKGRHRGKLTKLTESLFPRYLFIKLSRVEDNWAPIRSTYGVAGLVRFGDQPLVVPDLIISDLQKREIYFQEKGLDIDVLKRGDTVTIGAGPFRGLQAVFERYNGEERAILLMNILNEQAKVVVPSADIYQTA